MYRVLCITILLFVQFLHVDKLYAQDTTETFNQVDDQNRKQGKWREYYRNGKLRYVGEFKDGKPVGKFYFYYETGQPRNYVIHKPNGVTYATTFHTNGNIMAFGKYVNQKRDSVWTYYAFREERVVADESYILGKKYGDHKVYYPTGQVAEVKHFENDLENGPWIQYYENGNKKMEATYVNSILEGKAYFYYLDGTKRIDGRYKKDVKHGLWTFYFENGNVDKQVQYENGKRKGQEGEELLPEPEMKVKQDRLTPEDLMKNFDPYKQ